MALVGRKNNKYFLLEMEDVSLQERGRADTLGEGFVFLDCGKKNVNDLLLD